MLKPRVDSWHQERTPGLMSAKPTIRVDTYIRRAAEDSGSNSYKGLLIHAVPGLHELVAEKALAYLPAGAQVLDLAAGSGAMCQRLLDLGFRVSAIDVVRSSFKLDHVPFFQADLNESFAATHAKRYQGIVRRALRNRRTHHPVDAVAGR